MTARAERNVVQPRVTEPDDITALLRAAAEGDKAAAHKLVPLVYDDLHALARARRSRWNGDETLNATALVHEAYVRLIERTRAPWYDRRHFFAVASRAMRQLLLNYAERRRAQKRGGGQQAVPESDPAAALDTNRADTIVAVDQLLTRLEELDPEKALVVEHRFYGGLDDEEIAKALGISSRTVRRQWQRARAWMHAALDGSIEL